MNVRVGRIFYHRFKRTKALKEFLRLSSTKEPCPSKSSETKETKAESSCPQPQTTESTCPPSPPCPGPPQCPPRLTNIIMESCDPCNYVPPPQRDPDYPDMTRIKKLQCKFQAVGDEIPIYLQGGRFSVFMYHFCLIFTLLGVAKSFHVLYTMRNK